MGTYLDKPITTKESSDSEGFLVKYGVSSMQGWRETQEDAHNTILDFDKYSSLFAVYDGHEGKQVAEYCSKYLPALIKKEENYLKGDYEQGMKDAFLRIDAELLRPEVATILRELKKQSTKSSRRSDYQIESNHVNRSEENPAIKSGTTALVAMLVGKELYVANVGDSRCVLCREGKAIKMSIDHSPLNKGERKRIEKAHGKVDDEGMINKKFGISRIIGDHLMKQMKELPPTEQLVIALPDVRRHTVDPSKDEFLVLACDGIWNVMKSQKVVDFVRNKLQTFKGKLSQICEELFDKCLAPESNYKDGKGCDNMTCIIVQFKPTLSSQPAVSQVRGQVPRR